MLTRTARRAFTLLELIIVLLILGILALIAVPSYNAVQQNSLDRSVLSTAQAIARDANAIAASGTAAGVATDTELEAAATEVTMPSGMTWNAGADTLTGTSGNLSASAQLTVTGGVYSAALTGAAPAPAGWTSAYSADAASWTFTRLGRSYTLELVPTMSPAEQAAEPWFVDSNFAAFRITNNGATTGMATIELSTADLGPTLPQGYVPDPEFYGYLYSNTVDSGETKFFMQFNNVDPLSSYPQTMWLYTATDSGFARIGSITR